jgi:hypothetical protein
VNLNQVFEKSSEDETLHHVIELNELGTQKRDQRDLKQIMNNDLGIRDESIRALLRSTDSINLSDIDALLSYITNVTLKTLLSNLFDMSIALNHKYIIEDLNTIVYTIGNCFH